MKRSVFIVILLLGLAEFGVGAWIPAKAWLSQVLLKQAWAETLIHQTPQKPWPWADTWPLLNLAYPDGKLLVLAGDSGQALAFGPGHMSGSSLPGGNGNIVISGHRDTHFHFLKDIKTDDLIQITDSDGKSHSYRVFSQEIIDSRTQRITDSDEEMLTLVTCYPFDSLIAGGPLRYILSARPVP